MSDTNTYGETILGLLVALCPVIFVWTMELLVTMDELRDNGLVFYVWEIPPVAAYHATMYAMFLASWGAAFSIVEWGIDR